MLKRCILSDFKKNWFLYPIIIAVFFLLGFIANIVFSNFTFIFDYKCFEDKKFESLYTFSSLDQTTYNLLMEQNRIIGQGYSINNCFYIDYQIVETFELPLSKGSWFEGSMPQIIANPRYADKYPIGSVVDVDNFEFSFPATVVGYFNHNYIVSLFGNYPMTDANIQCEYTLSGNIAEIVSSSTLSSPNHTVLVKLNSSEYEQIANDLSDSQHRFWGRSINEVYNSEVANNSSIIAFMVYMFFSLIMGIVIIVLVLSVTSEIISKNQMAISMLCGATKRNLCISEMLRILICVVFSFLILWLCVLKLPTVSISFSTNMPLSVATLGKSAIVIALSGLFLCGFNCLKICNINILNTIGGK